MSALTHLSVTHRMAKAVRTRLRDELGDSELSADERYALRMRWEAACALCHALARDIHAHRERLKREACAEEVGPVE